MKNNKLIKICLAAVLAALTCTATMVIQIPSPMNGYINLGDSVVLLSGWILGPLYGFFSAGIGSMLADLFSGYPHYAPGTFIIKGAMALVASIIPLIAAKKAHSNNILAKIAGGFLGETVMVLGYFGYASLLLGKGLAAASSIPGNLIQGVVGLISSVIIIVLLEKTKTLDKIKQ